MTRFAVLIAVFWIGIASAQTATTTSEDTNVEAPAEGQSAPLVTTELSEESVAVGQALTLRVSVLVPTWMPSPPAFPAMDIPNVIVRLPERASGPISQTVDGETWSGVSRAYRLYPMVAGVVSLPPQTIGVTYADPETTQPIDAEVHLSRTTFAATVPEGAEALDPMIIAEGLTLEQTFEGPDGALGEGDAMVRTVTARIEGTSPLFIPPLIPELVAEPVQAYARDPSVGESENRGKLSGTRTDTVTYVARYGGTVDLPEIAIEWFNVASGSVETATADGMALEIDAPAAPRDPILSRRQMTALAGAVVLLALVGWLLRRYVAPPLLTWMADRRAAREASEARAAAEVRKAVRERDLQAVTTAVAHWSMRCVPSIAPTDTLEQALADVGGAQFGGRGTKEAPPSDWAALERAFDTERRKRLAQMKASAQALPPLNPT